MIIVHAIGDLKCSRSQITEILLQQELHKYRKKQFKRMHCRPAYTGFKTLPEMTFTNEQSCSGSHALGQVKTAAL